MTVAASVAVVIPTRNRCDLLRRAVASVRAQTSTDWQLVIVDDASTDGTTSFLAEIDDERVVSVSNEQQSERSAARNRGARLATAPYLLFLDDDDELAPGAVSAILHAASRAPGTAAIVGARHDVRAGGPPRRYVHPRRVVRCRPWAEVALAWMPLPGQVAVRTADFWELGGWEEGRSFAEDLALWLRLFRRPAVLVPDNVATYHHHEGQRQPPDAAALDARVRHAFVDELAGAERRRAERVVSARPDFVAAMAAQRDGQHRRAARHFGRLVAADPRLLLSPILGAWVGGMTARAAVRSLSRRA